MKKISTSNFLQKMQEENLCKKQGLSLKDQKGITLIALVVTIVVLLILAGVTITMVLGEDGIIAQAKLAAEKTKDAIENEQGEIANLVDDLENILSSDIEENTPSSPSPSPELPIDLTEQEQSQITIGTPEATEDYGKIVKESSTDTNYQAGNITTWRLFYQDKDYTYIISNTLVNQSKSLETLYTNAGYGNINGNDVSTIGQKLNSQFKNFTSSNTNKNIKAVAYLTDPKNWQEYKTGNAVYAIGSPTIELFVKSYNATNNEHVIYFSPEDMGYQENTSSGWLTTGQRNGIYNTGSSDEWWVASPASNFVTNLLIVDESNGDVSNGGSLNGFTSAVRPLVCFRTSEFKDTYSLSDQ